MSADLSAPFIKAVTDILGTMAMVRAEPGEPYHKKDSSAVGDVTGVVGLTGARNGSLSLTFDKPCAIAIVKNMLGDDIDDILSDVKDAVGEITNMVSGQARAGLAEQGLQLQGGSPSVVMGENHTIAHMIAGQVTAVPFTTDAGKFTLEFGFEQERDA